MKKLTLILIVLLQALGAEDINSVWIDNMVEEIKPSRKGVDTALLERLKNPFIMVKEVKTKEGKIVKVVTKGKYRARGYRGAMRFKLYATMNRSAKINNRWYQLNKKINGYTLKKITKEYVTLQKGNREPINVYLHNKNKKIKILTK